MENRTDLIALLGELAFATRLRRVSERLANDVSKLYQKLDLDFDARWFSLFYLLTRDSPATITGAADQLGVSHTSVNQIAKELARKGLVRWSAGTKDRRQQHLRLTGRGRKAADSLKPVWKEIEAATKDLLDKSAGGILEELQAIERELESKDMYERVWERIHGSLPADIEIQEYNPSLKKYFRSLNVEWLREYFDAEEYDLAYLNDPRGKIIRKGGSVYFATLSGEVVGTCALIRHRNGILELAKMAVAPRYRGRGIGRELARAVIKRASGLGVAELFLCTSDRLEAANRLYRSLGFTRVNRNPFDVSVYRRKTIVMKLKLKKSTKIEENIHERT